MSPSLSFLRHSGKLRKHLNTPLDHSKRHKLGQKVLVKFISANEDLGVAVSGIEDVDDPSKVELGSLLTAVVKGGETNTTQYDFVKWEDAWSCARLKYC